MVIFIFLFVGLKFLFYVRECENKYTLFYKIKINVIYL